MRRALALAALVACTLGASPSPAASPASQANEIIQKMLDRNPSLQSYRSRVHISLRMLNFPYLAPKLDGTSYFKRPDNYVVAFDRVPSYAKGFSTLFEDVGDPAAWSRDQNVVLDGRSTLDGRPMLVLRLTKKIPSSILAYSLAFVDAQTYDLKRMEWHYTSGGTIVMTQTYRSQGNYAVLDSQHATIDIPHIRAVADSTYGQYETNVVLSDTVFASR